MTPVMGVEVEYAVVLTGSGRALVSARDMARQVVASHPAALAPLGVRSYGSAIDGMLSNGARLYDDLGHPEYSTPECKDLRTLICCDKAGERLMQACAEACSARLPSGATLSVLKSNTDHAGHTWGCHENYLVTPRLFEELVVEPGPPLSGALVPFLATRQLISGSGRVGGEGGWSGYQLSQRADFIRTVLGSETTSARPIVNTRDEPLADRSRFRRLHLVIGDSNMSEYATYLKLGTTRLLLRMLEDDALPCNLALEDPVGATHAVSRRADSSLALLDGHRWTALDIQMELHGRAVEYLARSGSDPDEQFVAAEWGNVLRTLGADPLALSDRLDWAIKLAFLESVRADEKLAWSDPLLRELDLRYHDICPRRGLYEALASEGVVHRFAWLQDGISCRTTEPPGDTRAHVRAGVLREQGEGVVDVAWDHLVCGAGRFDWPDPTES